MSEAQPSEGLYGEGGQAARPAGPAAPGLMDQVMGVFTEPVALFQRLAVTPVWGGALSLSIVATVAMTALWTWKVEADAFFRPILERNPRVTPDNIDKIIEMQSKFLPLGIVAVPIIICLFALLGALVFWLIGKFTAEGEPPTFRQAFCASVVPNLVSLPKVLLMGLMCLLKPVLVSPEKLTPTSIGYFANPESFKLHEFLFRLDLFAIAGLVLMALAARHLLRLKPLGVALCLAFGTFFMIIFPALAAK